VVKFLLTNQAAIDLLDIADFTIQTFGIEQARFYRDGLNHCFEILAENTQLGRNATKFALNPETIRVSIPCRVLYPQGVAYFAPAHGFLAAFTRIFNKIATHQQSSRLLSLPVSYKL
jgi:plasmid stabilization system protein ParE